MRFPLRKLAVKINNSETEFLDDYHEVTEIPLLPHPGAFAKIRKNHIHEGVDLYCNNGDEVIAIESGMIVKIHPFTGEMVNMPWWNNTWSLLIEGNNYAINYGELIPLSHLKEGDTVKEGQVIGHITTVLKTNKGRPMNMLHLEQYEKGTKEPIFEWKLNEEKPSQLIDPTELILNLAKENNLIENEGFKKIKNKL